jgi:H+/gluconate symporter-like permease
MFELMGRVHARLAHERGQGTVEYVGLVLLLGVILAGVVAATGGFEDDTIVTTIVSKLKGAIESVGGDGGTGPNGI